MRDNIGVMVELEKFLDSPLGYYAKDPSDLFSLAFGNAFKVKVIVFQSNTERCWIVDSSKNSSDLPSLYFGITLLTHIKPIIKNKQMSKEDNFDEDNVAITKCIGDNGVEEKSNDDEIILTNYIPGSIPKPITGSVKSEDCSGAGSVKSEDRSGKFYY